jgi:ketosteroid isomerase-like protein
MQTDVQTEIEALSVVKAQWAVDGDVERLGELLDDDLVFVHLDGHVSSKREWLDDIASSGYTYRDFAASDTRVHVHGDTAVLVAAQAVTTQGGVWHLRVSEVYVLKAGAWKLVSMHACLNR